VRAIARSTLCRWVRTEGAPAYAGRMAALLTLRFVAELGMLACLAWGGWQRGDGLAPSLALAVGLPVSAALIWGRWVAPRAPRRLDDPLRLGVEVVLFTSAVLVVATYVVPPSPSTLVGVVVWAAFLASIPARGHEPVPGKK